MIRFLRRLRGTGTDEIWFRSAESARVAIEALRFVSGCGRWRRQSFQSQLIASSKELTLARAALARQDWSGANVAIASHFLRRPSRFLIDPAARVPFSRATHRLFPAALEDAVRRADKLRAGHYDLLGYRSLSFRSDTTPVDWHLDPVHQRRAPARFWGRVPYLDPRLGDHKIIWELNRHQHWLVLGRAAWLTGDKRYANRVAAELESWMSANPPLAGINWSSMLELAFRSLSWVWALHFLAAFEPESDSTCLVDLLLGLDMQLDHVARHLSRYFSPNTHLLGEGLALYVAGRVLPELRRSAKWARIGREVLLCEARAQVHPDGGHAERAAHYHRYALDFYLLALAVARKTGDPAAEPFAAVASRLASFCRAMADDDGWLPTIGDDDGGLLLPMCGRPPADASDSLWLAGALLGRADLAVGNPPEEAAWMLGPEAISSATPSPPTEPASQLYPDTGFAVLRGPGGHAILDAGPHGFLNGGHAHAGALALVLSTRGRQLLIDPGTATYTMDPRLRDRFRSTAMHNTIVLDGRSQSRPAGPFHWESRANGRIVLWRPGLLPRHAPDACTAGEGGGTDYIEAEHDGYLPVVHRRAALRAPHGLWIIADHILGAGSHDVAAHWHIAPAWASVANGSADTTLVHPDGLWASMAFTWRQRHEFRGDESGLGWCAPVYGQLVAATTLRVSEKAEAPFSLITALVTGASPVRVSVEPARVMGEQRDAWHRAAARVTCGDMQFLVLFAAPGSGNETGAGPRCVQQLALSNGDFHTDARAVLLSIPSCGEPVPLALVDASEARWTGRPGRQKPAAESVRERFEASQPAGERDAQQRWA